jgi:Na+/H+-dicarboxylate symporter
MKIWIKLLIGSALGIAIGMLLHPEASSSKALVFLLEFAIRIGRYAFLPLMFFSLPIAVFELYEDKRLVPVLGKTALLSVVSVFAATALGAASAFLLKPDRIPLASETSATEPLASAGDLILGLFPRNAFEALVSGGDGLAPLLILAVILGLAFSFDQAVTKPAVSLFDSFSRILYQINSFFVEILAVFTIIAALCNTRAFRTALSLHLYRGLLASVGIEVLFVVLIVIPAILYFAGGKKNPFPILYAFLAPALAALVSGDLFFGAGTLAKHSKESLGIRRRIGTLTLPVALLLGRAGTSLVTATSFIVVLNSYSNLGLTPGNLFWLLLFVPLSSLLLGFSPGKGPSAALALLSSLYGRGFETGYLLVAQAALPLLLAGAFLDTVWAGCVSWLVAKSEGMATEREIRRYI